MKRKRVLAVVAAGLVVAVAAGLYWFQPWKLWVNETVQEAAPVVAQPSAAPSALPSESAAPARKSPRSWRPAR
ncbi:hypothetical protein [Amycolatopsis sp. EV170708-02-1]|uniref:hypothetical protein n=1 Tax=Amycolatopsis sp. EV170708-02-1 TaxID=2919322 RepID=UPI0037C04BD5